ADLRPGQYGEGYARLARVPGREYRAFARVPGARQPHRVMAQVPDGFDRARRCLVVAPVSGSRGIYGAQALAAIALARGCAVATTDKGAGSDVFDLAADEGAALDGTRARRGEAPLAFEPPPGTGGEPLLALKHAHSGDHPEADWGRHALQAAAFGLHALALAFPELAPFTPENTRILGLGISNGAAALVHALEQDREGIFDGAVLGAPNLAVPGRPALYEYATLAALLQPCLLADPAAAAAPFARGNPLLAAAAALRCAELQRRGLLPPGPPAAAAAAARAELLAAGFDEPSLRLAAMNVALDLWRTVAVSYASAYLRRGPAAMPCGYRIAVLAAPGLARPATPGERALWWASANGLAPSGEIGLLDARAAPPDPFLPGLLCLRELATGEGEEARALREAVAATRVSGRLPPVPVILIHGREDALIPAALSSRPYAELARASGARLEYRELPEVQHFDAFLGHPELAGFRPLLPELERALDELLAPR
ncbi:MAG: 3-hydroxybutyrate oligomer hydrolase family protein, partial [Acetobacteraceae bacterium]|nr:3-hydroxybutyrate oligomer hydrolase family protein [Acetobacteraceae bacterium]